MFDDALMLSRIQFALNISLHILFPTIKHCFGVDYGVFLGIMLCGTLLLP